MTLILGDASGLGEAFATRIADRSARVVLVTEADEFEFAAGQGDEDRFERATISIDDPTHYRRLIEQLCLDPAQMLRIVHTMASDLHTPAVDQSTRQGDDQGIDSHVERSRLVAAGATMFLYQALADISFTTNPKILLVTRGGQIVAPERPVNVHQQELIGVGRVATLEFAGFDTRCVDLDPTVDFDITVSTRIALLTRMPAAIGPRCCVTWRLNGRRPATKRKSPIRMACGCARESNRSRRTIKILRCCLAAVRFA